MKIFLPQSRRRPGTDRRLAGYTLVEVMFASTISVMVVMAIIVANLMGLCEDQLVESKEGASDTSRRVLNQLPVDIKSCKMWLIGNYSGSTFTSIANSAAQQGPALQLFETTNGSSYVIYYFDLSQATNNNGLLKRLTSSNSTPVILASNLVNWLGNGYSFTAENYSGVVATNQGSSKAYKNVIHAVLQFCEFQFPLTQVGTNGLYDYYKLEFRATPHLPE